MDAEPHLSYNCVYIEFLGVISTEPLTWRLVKVWLPVNVIFVGMLITSMFRYEVGTHYFYNSIIGHLGA